LIGDLSCNAPNSPLGTGEFVAEAARV